MVMKHQVRGIGDQKQSKKLEGSGHGLLQNTIPEFTWRLGNQ